VLRLAAFVGAGLLVALGVVWTLQGLGYVGEENRTLGLLGPLSAGLGVALVIVVVQSIRRSRATKGRVGGRYDHRGGRRG